MPPEDGTRLLTPEGGRPWACDVNKGASESYWRTFGVGHLGGMEDVFQR